MRSSRRRPRGRRLLLLAGITLVVLLGLAQAVPYGRSHTNPPTTKEPAWDSPRTRELAARACFDCHSNLTTWTWYSNVAPVSWLVQSDVDGGRSALNFTEWNRPQDAGAADVAEAIRSGGMPPWFYRLLHARAGLSASEKQELVAGLTATFAASPPVAGGGG